jgi:hypothetical protein
MKLETTSAGLEAELRIAGIGRFFGAAISNFMQLKRRHELIPRLVNAIKGYREYEQTAQTALTEMRNQLAPRRPVSPGRIYHALRDTILALAESYPELKADETFAILGKSLSDTEDRIALARAYFNEIATHYYTRLEIVPERFVARLAKLKPQPLMLADGFQRARAIARDRR